MSQIFVIVLIIASGWDLLFTDFPKPPGQPLYHTSDYFQLFLICLSCLIVDVLIFIFKRMSK